MNTQELTTNSDALLSLIQQIKENYQEPEPKPRKRGKQPSYTDKSFLLLSVVAVTTRTFSDKELSRLLTKDDDLLRVLEFEKVPHRTTIGRRIIKLVPVAEEQIRLFGKLIIEEVKLSEDQTQLGVIDGRMYEAVGPRWHKKDRLLQRIPVGLRNVDVESKWSKSGYRGWVQGYRLMIEGLAFPEPVPVWAAWRPNNMNEAVIAQKALEEETFQVFDVLLGDETFGSFEFTTQYKEAGGWVLTPKQLPDERRSWKNDLYEYRKQTIELLFQRVIQASELKKCKVKGEARNGAFVLASVWLYQLCYMDNYRNEKSCACVKEQLDAARWRIKSS